MKSLFTLFFILILSINSTYAEDVHESDRAALKALLSGVETAINKKDIDYLASILDKDVVVIYLDAEVARGIPAVRSYFEKTLGGSNAILTEYRTKGKVGAPAIFHNNVALADGTAKDEFVFLDGRVMTVNTNWTTAIVKNGGAWKVAQLHFSTNVFDNAILTAAEKSVLLFSIIAIIIGLIIGFVVGRKTAK